MSCLCQRLPERKGCQSHLEKNYYYWVRFILCYINWASFSSIHSQFYNSKLSSHLGWWNGSRSCEGAGKQTQVVSVAGIQCHFLWCCHQAGTLGQARWTRHPLWSGGEEDHCQNRFEGSQTSSPYISSCSLSSPLLHNLTAGSCLGNDRRKVTEEEERVAGII